MNALAEVFPSSTGPTTRVESAQFSVPTVSSVSVNPYRGAVTKQRLDEMIEEAFDDTFQQYYHTYLFDWSKTRSAFPNTVPLTQRGPGEPSFVFVANEYPTLFHLLLPPSLDPSKARQTLNISKLEASLDEVLASKGFVKIAAGVDALGAWTLDFTRGYDRVTAAISQTVIQIMSFSKGAFDERRFARSAPWSQIEQFIVFDLMR